MKVLLLSISILFISCGKTQTVKEVINNVETVREVDTLDFIDPCGDNPGKFDEVLVKTDAGIAGYFEQGNQRFLTILTDGDYITTDSQQCRFSIQGGEYVEF